MDISWELTDEEDEDEFDEDEDEDEEDRELAEEDEDEDGARPHFFGCLAGWVGCVTTTTYLYVPAYRV